MVRINNVPPVVEEVRMEEQKSEQEIVVGLREEVEGLQGENKKFRLLSLFRKKKVGKLEKDLSEEKRHSDRMDDLAWETFRAKDRFEEEKNEEVSNLEVELVREREKNELLQQRVNNLQLELEKIPTKRTWKSFYDWIVDNIAEFHNSNNFYELDRKLGRNIRLSWPRTEGICCDEPEKLYFKEKDRDLYLVDGNLVFVKPSKKDIYKISDDWGNLALFLKLLKKEEGTINFYLKNNLGVGNIIHRYCTIYPYREVKDLKEIIDISRVNHNSSEFQRMFDDWKYDTPLRNTTE